MPETSMTDSTPKISSSPWIWLSCKYIWSGQVFSGAVLGLVRLLNGKSLGIFRLTGLVKEANERDRPFLESKALLALNLWSNSFWFNTRWSLGVGGDFLAGNLRDGILTSWLTTIVCLTSSSILTADSLVASKWHWYLFCSALIDKHKSESEAILW